VSGVLLLELNELSPELLDRFLALGHLPHFARMRGESQVFVTEAAERPPMLEPWIQWVTLHSGLSQAEHGVLQLDEGARVPAPFVWEVLSRRGLPVWVCGAMNTREDADLRGGLLPDPWTTDTEPRPRELLPFARFVQSRVQEYTNAAAKPDAAETARVGAFLARHGLRARTAAAIARQLAAERVRPGRGAWRRAALLDQILFDVFRHYFARLRPRFATVFANCVAHYQHLYWRDMAPEAFAAKGDDLDGDRSGAILHGFRVLDGIVGDALALAGRDTTVVLTTALSQKPCLKYESVGGMRIYRPRDVPALAAFAGAPAGFRASAVMSNEVVLHYGDARDAERAAEALRALTLDGERAMNAEARDGRLVTHLRIKSDLAADAVVAGPDGRTARLYDLFYKVDAMKSGIHDPRGLLWVRTPRREHAVHSATVPLTAVAPTLLDMFAAPPTHAMRTPALRGFHGIAAGADRQEPTHAGIS